MDGYEPELIAHIRLTEEAIQSDNKVLAMHHVTMARRRANEVVSEVAQLEVRIKVLEANISKSVLRRIDAQIGEDSD